MSDQLDRTAAMRLSPRCGAKTRGGGACRAPALRGNPAQVMQTMIDSFGGNERPLALLIRGLAGGDEGAKSK